jgi:lysophosphatidylcholine acyltransferase/lyso-PAF acetyltransferase
VIQAVLVATLVGPFRFLLFLPALFFAWFFSALSVFGWPPKSQEPLPRWRLAIQAPVPFMWRAWIFSMGYHFIRVKGTPAQRSEAPICVVNHQSFLDAFILFSMGRLGTVAKEEVLKIPFCKHILQAGQTLTVNRTNRQSSSSVLQQIEERAKSEKPWPPLFMFPEGTCTNGTAVIAFKRGAFAPGKPVQPITIRYKWSNVDPCKVYGGGPGIASIICRLFTTLDSSAEVHFLPVVIPTPEEQADPMLFSDRVRGVMANDLGVPKTTHCYHDVQLLLGARKAFSSQASSSRRRAAKRVARYLELGKLEELMGCKVTVDQATEYLKMFAAALTKSPSGSSTLRSVASGGISGQLEEGLSGELTYDQFIEALQLPDDGISERIFYMFDMDENGMLNIREFVATLAFLTNKGDMEAAMDAAFSAVDQDGDGLVTSREVQQLVRATTQRPCSDTVDKLIGDHSRNRSEGLTKEEYMGFLRANPAYLSLMWGGGSPPAPAPGAPAPSSPRAS